jgi:O-methyltransferase involved in polyketide biosynthesis
LTLVPVDFETDDLATELESTAFTRAEPAIFFWLGVVFYLTPSVVRATLEYIVGQAQPTEVVFDYLQPANTDEDRAHLRARADRLADAGEPFFSYFTPVEIHQRLRALGFTDIEDHTARDVIGRYLDRPPEFEEEPSRALRSRRILRARR